MMKEVHVSVMTMHGLVKPCQATQPVVITFFFFRFVLRTGNCRNKTRKRCGILQI